MNTDKDAMTAKTTHACRVMKDGRGAMTLQLAQARLGPTVNAQGRLAKIGKAGSAAPAADEQLSRLSPTLGALVQQYMKPRMFKSGMAFRKIQADTTPAATKDERWPEQKHDER